MSTPKKVTYSGYRFVGKDSSYEVYSLIVKEYYVPWFVKNYVIEKEYLVAASPYSTDSNIISQRYGRLSFYPSMRSLSAHSMCHKGIRYYIHTMIFNEANGNEIDIKKEYTLKMLEP